MGLGAGALGELAGAVCVEKGAQVEDLLANVGAGVGVVYRKGSRLHFEAVVVAHDVCVEVEDVGNRAEGPVRLDAHAARVGDEGVARDARRLVIGLAEASVDDDESAPGAHSLLAVCGMDGRVPVDDVPSLGVNAKLLEDASADPLVVRERVVGVARLGPRAAILEVGALKGLDHATRERGVAPAPEVPHPVERDLVMLVPSTARQAVGVVVVGLARK